MKRRKGRSRSRRGFLVAFWFWLGGFGGGHWGGEVIGSCGRFGFGGFWYMLDGWRVGVLSYPVVGCANGHSREYRVGIGPGARAGA